MALSRVQVQAQLFAVTAGQITAHAHGQGYTDLNFLVPEFVRALDYKLGVSHAELGDFGSAGGPDLLIVVDRLLTGFDEPRNTVLYIDKPLRAHGLIQAVARVNRLHEAKRHGVLLDYRGILKELDTAMRAASCSTAPPPALAHAARASLARISSAEGDTLRQRLRGNIDILAPGHPSPVIPHILGESGTALAAAPGTANAFTFNVDSFAMYKLKDAGAQKAQADLAAAIMSPPFQEVFNLNKGSIPVRAGQPMDKFDDCAKASAKDFVDTAKSGGLVPSAAHGMAIAPATEGAIKDVVSQFWNDDKVSVADAMKKIAAAAKTK